MPPLGAGFSLWLNPGDKTMASVSLQSRLTLNCKLSCLTSSGSALTVGIVQALRSGKTAPSGGRKFVQTSAEDKLVWTMPSAAEFGETQ